MFSELAILVEILSFLLFGLSVICLWELVLENGF